MPNRHCRRRRGSISILATIVLILALGLLVLSIDLGFINLARAEAQRTADAATLAAVDALLEQRASRKVSGSAIVESATEYCRMNPVNGGAVAVGESRDMAMGRLSKGKVNSSADFNEWNAVRVSVQLDGTSNARMPLHFAKFFRRSEASIGANATAVFGDRFRGFQTVNPRDKEAGNAPLLPFTYPLSDWEQTIAGDGTDNFAWDADRQTFSYGKDGMHEFVLYPLDQGGGNFGTVDIGSNNSNTPRLRRQISQGITTADLAFHGGKLSLDQRGRTELSADSGLKAGAIQGELRSIIGQPRIIPLNTALQGNGQNATYEIRAFAGVRIIEVALTGNEKRVLVQPAAVVTRTGIPDEDGKESSFLIFSPARLSD